MSVDTPTPPSAEGMPTQTGPDSRRMSRRAVYLRSRTSIRRGRIERWRWLSAALLILAAGLALWILFSREQFTDGFLARRSPGTTSLSVPESPDGLASPASRAPRFNPALAPLPPVANAEADDGLVDDPAIRAEVYSRTSQAETSASIELSLAAGRGSAIGWVVDARGSSVADAVVKAEFLGAPGDPEYPRKPDPSAARRVRSDATGSFAIDGLPVGNWVLSATLHGFGPANSGPVAVPLAARTEPIRLRLTDAITLKGRAVTAAGSPVRDATIRLLRPLALANASGEVDTVLLDLDARATTAIDGSFEVRSLPPGRLRLEATASGFATQRLPLDLAAGTPPLTITFAPEAPFGGLVRDSRARPIEGARITVSHPGRQGDVLARAVTTRDGGFNVAGLATGQEVDVIAEAEGLPRTGPLRLVGGTTQNLIVMGRGGAIEGRVTMLEDGTAAPVLAIVAEETTARPRLLYRTTTRADGRYRLDALPPGEYVVSVRNDRLVATERPPQKVDEGKLAKGIDVQVYEGIELRGRVLDENSREGIPGAVIKVRALAGPPLPSTIPARAISDARGDFQFRALPARRFRVGAEAAGYASSADLDADITVSLSRRQPPGPIELRLAKGGRIEGAVTLPDGAPAVGATVELLVPGDATATARLGRFARPADSAGRYIIDGLPLRSPLNAHVAALAANGLRGRSNLVALDSLQPSAQADVAISVGSSLAVQVRSTGGAMLAGARVSLRHRDYEGLRVPEAWTATTASDGACLLPGIPDGSASIVASAPGHTEEQATVTVPKGGSTVLTLAPAFMIRGRVIDDFGRTFERGVVVARPQAGARGRATARIGEGGAFVLEGLAAGQFTLRVTISSGEGAGARSLEHQVENIPAGPSQSIDLVVPSNGAIRARVLSADGSKPLAAFEGQVETMQLDFVPGVRPPAFTVRGRDGAFRADRLPPGRYRVEFKAAGHADLRTEEIQVSSPGTADLDEIVLRPGGFVRMQAVDDSSGAAIEGVTVRARESGDERSTAASGAVLLGPLPPGLYTLDVRHPDYLPAERRLVQVVAARETDEGRVRLRKGTTLKGRVLDSRGRAVAGARVEVRPGEQAERRDATSDTGGRFEIRGLPPGEAALVATARVGRSRATARARISLGGAATESVEVTLVAESTLRGTLIPPRGADASRAVVDLYPLDDFGTPMLNDSIPAAVSQSAFRAESISEGIYLVTARAPNAAGGESRWFATSEVRGEESYAVVAAGEGALTGTGNTTSGGAPLGGQRVVLGLLSAPQSGIERLSRWWRWETFTAADGSYAVTGLPTGIYQFVAANPAFPGDVLEVFTLRPEAPGLRASFHFLPQPALVTDAP